MQRGPGDGYGEGDLDAGVRETLDRLQVETRALREALERTARHGHEVDPSPSHLARFEECPHPTCRQARALLPEPDVVRGVDRVEPPPPLPHRPAVELEGLGGAAEPTARATDEDTEPSWIPLERSSTPPQRRPAPPRAEPVERPEPADPAERAERPEPQEPPIRPEPPIQPEPPQPEPPREPVPEPPREPVPEPPREPVPEPRREPVPEPPTPEPEPAGARAEPEAPAAGPLVPEAEGPSWGPPAIDLPPEAASAEDEAMAGAEERPGPEEEPSIPAHVFDAPPRERHTLEEEPRREPAPVTSDVRPRHTPARDPNIADSAADAIDRLARALFGPKRRRY